MYNVSSEFLEAIKQPARDFESKVIIRDKEYDDNVIIDMSQEEIVNPGDDFSLGSVASTKFEITLLEVEEIFENAEVKPYIGLNVDGVVEYVPLGVFTVDEVNKQNKKVKLTCFDNMIKMEKPYFSDLNYPATLQAIAEEISSKAGVIFNSTLPNHTIDKIEGYSLREAIGFIASACGGFARFNRLGQLEIKSYTDTDIVITGDNYFNFETADKEYKINKITAIKGEEQLSKGNVIEFGREVVFENPAITDSILTDIYNKINGFSYMPYTLKWQGNLALEAGDKVKIIDIKGNEYNTIVMQQKINYNGGLSAETKAVGKSEQANKFDSKGSITQRIERYSIEQANIRKALIEKANVVDLEVVNAKIENALIEKLDVIEFNSKIGIIETALIGKADIEDLTVLRGEFNTLKTVDFEAVKGDITNLTSSVADINTLLNGNLTSENMQAGAITATSGVIANGAITNAMIANIDAGKINTGFINTNNVTVKSEEGNLRIEGNTLKVWDSLGKERISLGKNDTDYNLLVRGKDGQTVLFGVDGVTNAGITEGAVDDSKVAPNANISGDKLNISSVVTKINEGTTKIESSHINYDGQSLNVAFGSLKTQVDETESKTNALITDFQIEQGRINTLISDVEIIESEVSSTKSNVSSLTQTVNSMKSSISSLQTENQTIKDDITGLSTEISTTQSNLALFKQDLDGFKTTVHDTYATKQSVTDIDGRVFSLNEKTTIMESNIAQNKTDIAFKVSQADVEKLINDIEIGGRNLFRPNERAQNRTSSEVVKIAPTSFYICSSWGGYCYRIPIEEKEKITVSFWYKLKTDTSTSFTVHPIMYDDTGRVGTYSYHPNNATDEWQYYKKTFETYEGSLEMDLHFITRISGAEIWINGIKLERGNKATDWTLAPEDVENEITSINTKMADININLDSITERVSSTESKIIKVNDEVSAIESRVSIAERKITDDSIINTVRESTAYKADLDGKANESDLKVAESIIEQHTDEIAKRVTIDGLGSEIIQNANSVRIAVGKIGATNLIQYSNIGSRGKMIKDKYIYDGTIILEPQNLNEGASIKIPQIKPNTEYTLSFKYKKLDGSLKAFGGHTDSTYSNNIATVDGKGNKPLSDSSSIFVADDAETHEVVVKFKTGNTVSPNDLFYLQPNRSQDGIYVKIEITELQFEEGDYVTAWKPYPGEGEGPGYLLTGDTATFKNTSLKIINENNYPVFEGTTDGMLKIMAQITTGYQIGYNLSIIGNSINFEYAKANEGRHQVGSIAAGLNPFGVSGQLEEGIGIDHSYGRHISIGGWTNTGEPYSYLVFDRENRLGYMPEFPVIFLKNVGFYGRARHMSNLEVLNNNRIYFKTGSSTHEPYVYAGGVNGDWLNLNAYNFALNGTSGSPRIEHQASTGKTVFFANTHVNKNFTVSGSKNSLQKTKNYGDRLLNALETAEYFFKDIGSGKTDETGYCYIYIEDIFSETVNTNMQYYVDVQKYGPGDIYPIKRTPVYFVIKGTPNLEFGWTLTVKRVGYEYDRLEQIFDKHESAPTSLDWLMEDETIKEDNEELKTIIDKELSKRSDDDDI